MGCKQTTLRNPTLHASKIGSQGLGNNTPSGVSSAATPNDKKKSTIDNIPAFLGTMLASEISQIRLDYGKTSASEFMRDDDPRYDHEMLQLFLSYATVLSHCITPFPSTHQELVSETISQMDEVVAHISSVHAIPCVRERRNMKQNARDRMSLDPLDGTQKAELVGMWLDFGELTMPFSEIVITLQHMGIYITVKALQRIASQVLPKNMNVKGDVEDGGVRGILTYPQFLLLHRALTKWPELNAWVPPGPSTTFLKDFFLRTQGGQIFRPDDQTLVSRLLGNVPQKTYYTTEDLGRVLVQPSINSATHPSSVGSIYHEMTQPLDHYFILSCDDLLCLPTKNDNLTQSLALNHIKSVMLDGCRACVVKCSFDEVSQTPCVVCSGENTSSMSSSRRPILVPLADVLRTVLMYGFQSSLYPIILIIDIMDPSTTHVEQFEHVFQLVLKDALLTRQRVSPSSSLSNNDEILPHLNPFRWKGHILLMQKDTAQSKLNSSLLLSYIRMKRSSLSPSTTTTKMHYADPCQSPTGEWASGTQLVFTEWNVRNSLSSRIALNAFQDNGRCGYLLKPLGIRDSPQTATSNVHTDKVYLSLSVLSLHGLCNSSQFDHDGFDKAWHQNGHKLEVAAMLRGCSEDNEDQFIRASLQPDLSLEAFHIVFSPNHQRRLVHSKELCYLIVQVRFIDKLVGEGIVPLRALRQGIRMLSLHNEFGIPLSVHSAGGDTSITPPPTGILIHVGLETCTQ